MKFVCDRDEILKHVSYAESIVSTKTTITLLLNILIETDENRIKLSSTDFKVGIKTYVSANIEKIGAITLNAKKLLEVVKAFPPCKLQFSLDNNDKVTITSLDSKLQVKYDIKGLPKDEYPTVKGFQEQDDFEIEQDILKKIIKKTIYAIYTQEDRIFLNGIFFVKNGTNLKLVSTDGRRLALADHTLASEGNVKKFTAIVPAKVLQELQKILTNQGKCQIAISENENQIYFKINEVELVSNLLEGKFPNYEQVIPQQHEMEISIMALGLSEALRRSSSMVDAKSGNIRCTLLNNTLIIHSTDPEQGEFEEKIEIDYPKNEPFEIAFNVNYFLDAIREFDEAELFLKINQSQTPVLIQGKGNESYLAIIMPIKITSDQ